MMRRRPVGRSLVRTAATTAVVVGTANVVNRAMTPKERGFSEQDAYAMQQQAYNQGAVDAQQQAYAQQQAAAQQQAYAQQAASSASGSMTQQQISELQQLAQLKDQGIITDEEFAAKKKQILGL